MKKITKILLIILSFFLINIDVYAEEEEETIEDDTYKVSQVSYVQNKWNNLWMADNFANGNDNSLGISYGYGGVASVFKYVLTSTTNNENILGYCLSPDKQIPTNIDFDSSEGVVGRRKNLEKVDAAYSAILSDSNACTDKDCLFESYVATSYALRAATYLFSSGQAVNNAGGHEDFTCGIYNMAIQWIAEEGLQEQARKVNSGYDTLPSICSPTDTLKLSDSNLKGEEALAMAKNMFLAGMASAYNTTNTQDARSGNITVKMSPSIIDVSPENTTEKSGELKTYETNITITVEDVDAKTNDKGELRNQFNIKDIECESCSQYGITFDKIKYSITGEVITEDKNLLEFLTAKNDYFDGEIVLTVSFTRSDDSECVPEIPFKVNYSYILPELIRDISIGYLSNDNPNDQDFVTVRKEDTDVELDDKNIVYTDSVTGRITCTEPDPEEEPPKCDEPTAFINPDCHENGILEIYGPKNVKDCILEKSDDTTNNKYELLGSKGGLSNKYCSVYCKEDYNEIYLQNTIDDVNCGSGFEIHARINGDKMCYTAGKGTAGKSGNDKYQINIQQFAQDIYTAQKTMIDAYNLYMYNKTGYERIKEKKYSCCKCTGNTECSGWKVENGNYTGYEIIEEYIYPDDKPKYKIKQLKIVPKEGINSEEGACKTTPCSYTYGCVPNPNGGTPICGWACTGDGVCEPPNVTLVQKKAAFKQAYEAALKQMEEAYKLYTESIKAIRDCTLSWTNDYDFLEDTIIKYYYNEHQGEDEYYTPYYDIIRDNKDDNEITLELIKDTNYTYSNYEERYWINDGVAGNGVDDNYKDGGLTDINGVLRNYNFATCDEKGCKIETSEIPRSVFVKRTLNHVKSYQVPTQFYDIGSTYSKIVYSEFEITDPYEGIPLENELPVTYNACTGGEFDLLIENLGEYYDREEGYGRLVDCDAYDDNGMFKCDPDTEVVVSAYQKANGEDVFTGRYVCDYNTDCDCEGQDTECDMSYGGKYYLTNENCGSVEIACCDIYATSYDRDTALAKGNKYICTFNNTMYDTYLEAKSACTDTRLVNGKYRCPDGSESKFGGCYMSPVKVENSDKLVCSDPNYHLEKVLTSEICVAEPIQDLSTCDDGYRNIGNNTCEKEYPIKATNGLSDIEVGTIIGECTTVDGQKISYAELSKKYTCDAKVCDTNLGGVYKDGDKCIEMKCCTDDICIHEEDGNEKYYLRNKLSKVTNIDKECPTKITNNCVANSNNINYYYTKNGNNVCVPACKDTDGTLRDTAGVPYDKKLGLQTIASSGKTKEQLCSSTDNTCLKEYGGLYAFEVNGKITCPKIDCCYAGDGDYKPCWNDTKTIIYNYNSLNQITTSEAEKICNGGIGNCNTIYEGYYYYSNRPADNYECFKIECCTDDLGNEDVCKVAGNGGVKFRNAITKVTNYETQCEHKIITCDESYGGLYKYRNTNTCFKVKCCDTGSGMCEAVAGNKVDRSSIVKVTDEKTECETPTVCLEEYGGKYAIPKCDGKCLECVDIKCCESNKANAICRDAAGNTYNRSGITPIGEEGTCDTSCPDECGCTPGDPDCPDPGCPKCKIKCGPDGCTIITTEDECPLCDFKCFNCIFNNGSFNLTTKQISTTVMNDIAKNNGGDNSESGNQAANRQYGYNWITNSHLSELNVPQELKEKMARITDKATETITQIGEAGETIYGGEKDTNSSALNFSIEMTPSVTDYLRNYNREHINDGGYGNESLKCYHDMEDGEVKYQYIYCFSEVIDELTENYGSKVNISSSRVTDEASRKANANSKNYWELWDEKVYSENAIGGPAWR